MIPKRLNSKLKLVSQFDPAFHTSFTVEQKEEYNKTLKIESLGNISEKSDKPTIFTCEPLKWKYEHLAYSDVLPDFWGIFATHVTDIVNCHIELDRDPNGHLEDSVREQIPPEIYQDIASKIIMLSNRSGEDVFFSRPAGYLAYSAAVQAKSATRKIVNTEAVKAKDSDLKESH